jgi:hypothetical protein
MCRYFPFILILFNKELEFVILIAFKTDYFLGITTGSAFDSILQLARTNKIKIYDEIKPEVFVLFCFVLFCFVLFCFVLFCFVLFCFVLFCFVLFCVVLFVCVFVCMCVCLYV